MSEKRKKIRQGDLVAVRSVSQILNSLDEHGRLDGLPFLSEMVKYCGQVFRVRRWVHKLIQEGSGTGMRSIKNVVLLEGPVCDGSNHGGCQRSCFPLWKTAWLEQIQSCLEGERSYAPASSHEAPQAATLLPHVKECQATEIIGATCPLGSWDPRSYYWDITSRIYAPYLTHIIQGFLNHLKRQLVRQMNMRKEANKQIPALPGDLGLCANELVEVKSAREICETLDAKGKSLGLYFMPGMWEYCGRRLRVLKPVNQMISERTGEMRHLSRTVILEGVTCDGKAHNGCQRGCYAFWKDTWLRRIRT
jgi:hypothetical protein